MIVHLFRMLDIKLFFLLFDKYLLNACCEFLPAIVLKLPLFDVVITQVMTL